VKAILGCIVGSVCGENMISDWTNNESNSCLSTVFVTGHATMIMSR